MTFHLKAIAFAYREKHRGAPGEVFRDLTVAIDDGECCVLLGREGSGKSTLLFLLDGLLRADAGDILIDGKDRFADPKEHQSVRKRIAMTFQFPEEQFLKPTVAEEFTDMLSLRGVRGDECAGRMTSSLIRVGLDASATAGRSPFTLSMGESRRLALALAHAVRPDAVLLDEPTAGMDAPGAAVIAAVLGEMKEQGATVVVATHDVDLAAEIADRVMILDQGRCAVEGAAGDVLTSASLLSRYGYGIPETAEEAEVLRREGAALPRGLLRRAELLALRRSV